MLLVLYCVIGAALLNFNDALGKDYFTAAVFEHRPRANVSDKSPAEIKVINLRFYEKAAVVASLKDVDILVFNEFGLFPYERDRVLLKQYAEHVPDPKKVQFNPCVERTRDRPALLALSCMARENEMYVVANVADIQPCEGSCAADGIEECRTKCPQDDVYMFNTNVAFNREGTLVAKYHKMNVYFENLNMEEEDDFATFDTEMGRFGLIVCFDSVFEFSYKLAREHGIDTMIFPTYWFDDIVPLKGVEWQQAWALGNRVNFLAANTQTPGTGSLGSGIYSKDEGALVYSYDPDGESKLLVANVRIGNAVTKIPTGKSITIISEYGVRTKEEETGDRFPEFCFDKTGKGPKSERGTISEKSSDIYDKYVCFKSPTEGYDLAKLDHSSGKLEVCQNSFCCSLTYSANNMNETYYLAVKNGKNDVHNYYFWWEQVCMVLRCDSFKNKDCFIQLSRSDTVFNSLELKATFSTDAVYPVVTNNKFRLAPKSEWDFEKTEFGTILKFESNSSQNSLLKAALLGRCYNRDPPYIPFYKN